MSRDGSRLDAKAIGCLGERIARDWLRAQGCKVLYRNFRAAHGGEIDIVARRDRQLMFVEVKTRREGTRIRGLSAVDATKRRLIERGAYAWLKKLGTREIPWRFDVIEVYLEHGAKPRVVCVENAF